MPALNAGSNITLTMGADDSVSVEVNAGASCVVEQPVGTRVAVVGAGSRQFGPFASGSQVKLSAEGGGIVYNVSDGTASPYLTEDQQAATQALVSEARKTLSFDGGLIPDPRQSAAVRVVCETNSATSGVIDGFEGGRCLAVVLAASATTSGVDSVRLGQATTLFATAAAAGLRFDEVAVAPATFTPQANASAAIISIRSAA